MQVNALQKGFLTLSDALLEELGEPLDFAHRACMSMHTAISNLALDVQSP